MSDLNDPTTTLAGRAIAAENWDRYRYALLRGHRQYTERARLLEDMYLGGGRQWSPEDLAVLKEQRRPAYEFNEILPSVNSALGHQIHNRLDIAFRPRGGNADQKLADVHAKVIMQVADRQHLHWKESEVFADGLIQQRGYYDVRVEFADNMQGNIVIAVRDPMDVIPDPDGKTYEPEGWADVITTGWLTLDEIEYQYGKDKRAEVERQHASDSDWGDGDDSGVARNKYGDPVNTGATFDSTYTDALVKRVRVIDRQKWVRQMSRCLFYPRTGDLKLAENLPEVLIQNQVNQGAVVTKAMKKRVRWCVSTMDTDLHDDWSPYNRFTIIPYFAYFRRGQTLGMVDNAIGPQMGLNKALSQFVHIVNTAANSGWTVEENSLTNMDTKELEAKGAMTGLVLEHRKGSAPPTKIQPNPVPQGVDRLIELMTESIKTVTVPEAMRGGQGPEVSGIAIQSKQFASQQQLAVPMDGLARTRQMLAEYLLELEQQFYTDERTLRVTEQDPATGQDVDSTLVVNQADGSGGYLNDLTVGEYDVVITEQPMQITFENSQFQQALELKKVGVNIPDTVMVQHSTLSRKQEIMEQMQSSAQPDPVDSAKVELLKAQTEQTQADTVNKAVEGIFSATQAANQIAGVPAIAPLADQLLKSAGFEDKDAAPIVGGPPPGAPAAALPTNTDPLTPANPGHPGAGVPGAPHLSAPVHPAVGMNQGIETVDPAQTEPLTTAQRNP